MRTLRFDLLLSTKEGGRAARGIGLLGRRFGRRRSWARGWPPWCRPVDARTSLVCVSTHCRHQCCCSPAGMTTPGCGANRDALGTLPGEVELDVIPGATHLSDEPDALDRVAELAGEFFTRQFGFSERD